MANGWGGKRENAGRKRNPLPKEMTDNALAQLNSLLDAGEIQAVRMVIDRSFAPLKAITPEDSLDAEYLRLKMKELSEFEQRLCALEKAIQNG
ncbi:TPA: hypothetical protein ACPVZP_003758 [Vibrio parahaemolyticus]